MLSLFLMSALPAIAADNPRTVVALEDTHFTPVLDFDTDELPLPEPEIEVVFDNGAVYDLDTHTVVEAGESTLADAEVAKRVVPLSYTDTLLAQATPISAGAIVSALAEHPDVAAELDRVFGLYDPVTATFVASRAYRTTRIDLVWNGGHTLLGPIYWADPCECTTYVDICEIGWISPANSTSFDFACLTTAHFYL